MTATKRDIELKQNAVRICTKQLAHHKFNLKWLEENKDIIPSTTYEEFYTLTIKGVERYTESLPKAKARLAQVLSKDYTEPQGEDIPGLGKYLPR